MKEPLLAIDIPVPSKIRTWAEAVCESWRKNDTKTIRMMKKIRA